MQIRVQDFVWALGLITAVLTAFYMTRSFMLTFTGRYRGHDDHGHGSHTAHHDAHGASHTDDAHAHTHHHAHGEVHESPAVVVIPLIVLAILSAGFGHFYGKDLLQYLSPWTRPDILAHMTHHSGENSEHAAVQHQATTHAQVDAGVKAVGTGDSESGLLEIEAQQEHFLELLSMALAVFSILGAVLCYLRYPSRLADFVGAKVMPGIHRFLSEKWKVDELYELVIVKPLLFFSKLLFTVFDRFIIDGTVNGAAAIVRAAGSGVKVFQSGRVSSYAFLMFSGTLILVAFWLVL